jgi:hypothetical protein
MKKIIFMIMILSTFTVKAEYLIKLHAFNSGTLQILEGNSGSETLVLPPSENEPNFNEITAGNAGSIMNLGYYDNMACNYSDIGGNQTQFNILAGLGSTTLLINGSVVNQLKNHVDENGNRYFYEDVNEDDINQPVENKYYIGQSTDDFMFYKVCT